MEDAKPINLADYHRSGCYRLEGRNKWRYVSPSCPWSHPAESEAERDRKFAEAIQEFRKREWRHVGARIRNPQRAW